jgi:hypothetical protein
MKVLICGGRDFVEQQKLNRVLNKIHAKTPITLVIHGDARGADRMGGSWAIVHHIDVQKFPADWDKFGRAAGMARNVQMLNEGKPDLCIACPGGYGTEHMVSLCRAVGIPIVEISP